MRRNTAARQAAGLLLVSLLAATAAGCARDDTADAMLDLDFWAFDQSWETGWRPVAERGEYGRAADLIDHYLAHRPGLNAAERAYLHNHAGELRAYQGDDRRALDHLAQAYVAPDSMPDRFPRSFNAMAAGTRAFMTGDMAGVRASVEAIRSLPVLSARDSMFLQGMEYLTTMEGKTYREAMLAEPE